MAMSQADQSVGNFSVFMAEFGLIAITGFTDAKNQACQAYADCFLTHGSLCQLTALRRLYYFLSMASLRISAFKRSSAYIFLSRRFSSPAPLNASSLKHPCRQTWCAIYRRLHYSCRARGTALEQECHFRLALRPREFGCR